MSSHRRSRSAGSSGRCADAATRPSSSWPVNVPALVRLEVDGREPRRQVLEIDARFAQVADERLVAQAHQHAADVEHYVTDHLWGCHPRISSSVKKPTTYATATCQPERSQGPTARASGKRFVIATPADEPNQIIEPPKPTA